MLAIVTFVLGSLCHEAREVQEFPDCGVACIYAFLAAQGKDVKVSEIENRVRELDPAAEFDRLSVSLLRRTLESYGLSMVSAHISQQKWSQVQLPAIIYLRPNRLGQSADRGHVMILQSLSDRGAQVIDLTQSNSVQWVSGSDLRQLWDGELLMLDNGSTDRQSSAYSIVRWGMIIGAVLLISFVILRRVREVFLPQGRQVEADL